MKKTTLLFTLLLMGLLSSAQTDTANKKLVYRPLTQQQVTLKTIPAAKAVLLRKDAVSCSCK